VYNIEQNILLKDQYTLVIKCLLYITSIYYFFLIFSVLFLHCKVIEYPEMHPGVHCIEINSLDVLLFC